jgi:D-alanine-D-alanine ligase
LEVSVLGNPPHYQVSGVGEVKPDGDFYSYDAKYASSSVSKVIIPAELTDEVKEQIRHLAGKIYEVLGCSGLSRVDFFLSDDGSIYLNEVNTFPGFTNISMYPKLWRQEGISYSELIERLISSAFDATIQSEQESEE